MRPATETLDQPPKSNAQQKRKLLPWWMKVFIWICLIFAGCTPIVLLLGILGNNVDLSIYGLESTDPFSPVGGLITILFFLKGVVSYGLWTGRKWAIALGIADAIIGIFICLYIMWNDLNSPGFSFRLELILLALYLIKLLDIREEWMADNKPFEFESNKSSQQPVEE